MNFVGVDLGTTGCKSVVFEQGGKILSQSYIEYGLIRKDGYIEQDPNLWWSLVVQAVAESIASCPIAATEIKALSISSQGISFVPVDESGRALHNAISWLDNRAVCQSERIARRFGEKNIFLRTGKRVSPCYTLPKLMWLREELPIVYRNTWKFLMGLDFIIYRLTNRAITDYSMASGTMAFDISKRRWAIDLLEACGVEAEKLPDTGCAGTLIGEIDAGIAASMGLPSGVQVFLGAQDQKCAALGAGIKEGIATVSLGTATAISTLCGTPVYDKRMRIPCFSFDETNWMLESVVGTSGASLKWLRNTLFEDMTYNEMMEFATHSPQGANGAMFFPHLQGAASPYWIGNASGTLHGITLATSRRDIIRAVLEGVAYQIAVNVSLHKEITGCTIKELRLFGGGANSSLWCGIIADITGKIVTVPYTTETANLGAAMLAGLRADSQLALQPQARFEPHDGPHRRYGEQLSDYLKKQNAILNSNGTGGFDGEA